MPGGFEVAIAGGVRFRVTAEAIEVEARPAAGAGAVEADDATGSGPVPSLHRSLLRPTEQGRRPTSVADAWAALEDAGRAADARGVAAALAGARHLHSGEVPEVSPPLIPAPGPVDGSAVHARHRRQAAASVGRLHRGRRRAALDASAAAAEREIADIRAEALAAHVRDQEDLDRRWEALVAGDPDVVLATLAEAFADRRLPAAPTGVAGDQVSVLVLVPGPGVIPDRLPSRTATGALSLRKMAASVLCGHYAAVVHGCVLAVVRQALAVCPGAAGVRGVAVRRTTGSAGPPGAEILLGAWFTRRALDGVDWRTADAGTVFSQLATEVVVRFEGPAWALAPIDPSWHPDLAALLDRLDVVGA